MRVAPFQRDGYKLLHDGAVALAEVEANGIRVDVNLLRRSMEDLRDKLRSLRKELEQEKEWKLWQRRYGAKANITSREQFSAVLHIELDYEVEDTTESGRPSTDEEALAKLENPFANKWVRLMKYDKALGTFLTGIQREVVGDRLHPVFNLHIARTFRSSSDSPNFQNFPVRDKEIAELIRKHFIASPHSVLLENDFKGIEVGVSACYHKDPNFISYITTPGKDMHRDMAAQIYMVKPEQVSKDARYGAKNKFVFPQFYGDYYLACARNLWEWIEKGKLLGPDGQPLKQHLRDKGIRSMGACVEDAKPKPGTFEKHLQDVENDFWNVRFMEYGRWRKVFYQAYLEKGYFDTLSGFRVHGTFGRNQVTNYPVQGSAFHCLLWTLIQVNKELRHYQMRSKVVGQIHDSLIGDVREDELRDYLEIVEEVVTERLRKHYPWLIVPLEVEYEICPPGAHWFQKREFKFKQGFFQHPSDPKRSTAEAAAFLRALL